MTIRATIPPTRAHLLLVLLTLSGIGSPSRLAADAPDLQKALKDANSRGSDLWIYNDIGAAMAEARKRNKPIFVTFRCVPCDACSSFDASVASGNGSVQRLARNEFISVRQVEMKNVDLSLFQFDFDLNWAAVFLNADGDIYARYGTQSAAGPDAYNSMVGLERTMRRVLKLHEENPGNRAALAGKRPAKKPYKTALEMPGLENKARLKGPTKRDNCIHCHNIHDAEQKAASDNGTFTRELLWRYPLPDSMGILIDADHGTRVRQVVRGGPAAATDLDVGEDVVSMNGQPMTSIADMQWVLHGLPNTDTTVTVTGSKSGKNVVALKKGWKESDISWRGSMWSLSPRLRVYFPPLSEKQRRKLSLPANTGALETRWINRGSASGKSAFAAGLREGDIVVALDGKPIDPKTVHRTFISSIKFTYKVGDTIRLTVLRNGKKKVIPIQLNE